MVRLALLCLCVTAASASIRILDGRVDCSQPGLKLCRISNCSGERTAVPRRFAPIGPEWCSVDVGVAADRRGRVLPVMNVTWRINSDGGVLTLLGSEISILDISANKRACVRFSFSIRQQLNPNYNKWTFSLDGVVVAPGHSYMVSVVNLPEPESEDYKKSQQVTISGCTIDSPIRRAQKCLENGSLWDPRVAASLSVNKHQVLSIVVGFRAAKYSERYQVSLQSDGFCHSEDVLRMNRTWVSVTFELDVSQLSECEIVFMIKPFFKGCQNDCWSPRKVIDYCPYYPRRTYLIKLTMALLFLGLCFASLLWLASRKDPANRSPSAAKEQPECLRVQRRRRVLLIYSLDHHLYKNIVLKLCAFLRAKCGTEVVLDLLDSARLGALGSIQWLDLQREQMGSSSDKILILCSRGVKAKWGAMCGAGRVFLREDARSPAGDMLTPALSLIVPGFVRRASFETYMVAYFDGVCSEDDVPLPFGVTVRYKLMSQFEELFFRILDAEKHEPGRVNHIEGLAEDEYHRCPSGRALRDAIEAFRAHQLEHPRWFEEELLESPDLEAEDTSAELLWDAITTTNDVWPQVIGRKSTRDSDSTEDKTRLYVTAQL